MQTKDRGIFVLRAVLGFGFLFAGLAKLFQWETPGQAFSAAGFLGHATGGQWLNSKGIVNPTHDFWVGLSTNAGLMQIINFLVVFGEIAIGVALVLGLATRFAGSMGALMMALFFIANWSFANGPFNEQLFYGLIAGVIAYVGAGAYALDTVIERLAITERVPAIKYVLG